MPRAPRPARPSVLRWRPRSSDPCCTFSAIASKRFEAQCGVLGVLALALVRGPLDPATVGAIAATVPDVEHVVRLPRPGGRKLFPSHRIPGWHRPGGLTVETQLLVAGVLLGAVLGAGLRR